MILEQVRMLHCLLFISSPDLSYFQEAVTDEEANRWLEDEGTEADDVSEIIFSGGSVSIFECELDGDTFDEVIGGVGLILETGIALDMAGLPPCVLLNF